MESTHLWQGVDHLRSQVQPGGSPAAEGSVVSCWSRLKRSGYFLVPYHRHDDAACHLKDLTSTVLLGIEGAGRQLERVPTSRLSEVRWRLRLETESDRMEVRFWKIPKTGKFDVLFIAKVNLTCCVSLLRRHWLISETRVSVRYE